MNLTLIGDGEDRHRLEEKIRAEKVEDRITLLGALEKEAVYQVLSRSHGILLTSSVEGCPMVLLEAQSRGCVPIATHLNGRTDVIVQDGKTGILCDFGEVESFAKAVEKLHLNRTLWQAMSNEAIRYMASEYTVKRMGEDYSDLIRQLMRGTIRSSRHSASSLRIRWIIAQNHSMKKMRKPNWRKTLRLFIKEWLGIKTVKEG